MKSATISLTERYAQALFELAYDEHQLNEVKRDLDALSTAMDEDADVREFLVSPFFSPHEKKTLFAEALGTHFTALALSFLDTVIRNGRAGFLDEIINRFGALWDRQKGIESVTVTVARELSTQRQEQLSADIAAILNAPIRMEVEVDPAIVGGVFIRCGDRIIDNTLRGRLGEAMTTLRKQIKSNAYGI